MNTTYLIALLQHYGYPFLWLVVFVAAAGAPISGSLLLSAAGAFAAFGDLNIFILFPLAVSAAVMGDNLTYWIGRRVGLPLLGWLGRQKRFKWISPQAVERARLYFRRRTGLAIFFTRFLIVVLGGAINLLAGIEEYPYQNFLFWDISGQILGAITSLGIGYIFAASWEDVAGIFGAFSGLVLAGLAAGILGILFIRRMRQQQAGTAGTTETINTSDTIETVVVESDIEVILAQEAEIELQEQKEEHPSNPLPISD